MNLRAALAALVISALSAAATDASAADASAADVDAKKTIAPLTTPDLLRLVSTTNKVRALFQESRRGSSNSSRRLGEGGDSCEAKLDECRADLGACQGGGETDGGDASILYVQMAQTCKIKEKTDGKGRLYYELSSKDMDDDTYAFADRPLRAAGAMSTRQFFQGFDSAFSEETGGRPNAAVTFRHRDTGNFEGPLISVFVEAAYRKDSGKYVYELTQSEEQEGVSALGDFFRKGDGKDDGVVEYEMCSLFIDSNSDGRRIDENGVSRCDPAKVDNCQMGDCAYQNYAEKDGSCKDCMCYDDSNNPRFCEKKSGKPARCVDKREHGDICHVSWQCKGGSSKCYQGICRSDEWMYGIY